MRAIELHFLHQHAADSLQDTALDLRAHTIGIDDLPAIMRAENPLDFHPSGRAFHHNFHADRHMRFVVLVVYVGNAASPRDRRILVWTRRRPRLPLHHRGHALDDLQATRIFQSA